MTWLTKLRRLIFGPSRAERLKSKRRSRHNRILRWGYGRRRKRFQFSCAVVLLLIGLSGCATYNKTGLYTPDGANYSISRDRQTGDLTDYFGLTWTLKQK